MCMTVEGVVQFRCMAACVSRPLNFMVKGIAQAVHSTLRTPQHAPKQSGISISH